MTSNLGSQRVHEANSNSETLDYESMKAQVMESVTAHFRPEFINRVDDIVVFHALQQDQVRAIANIQIEILRQRLAQQELNLQISDEALDLIAQAGFDPVYGARPLKRSIQQLVENPLAQKLLAGEYMLGQKITVSVKDNQLEFA